MTSTSPRLVVGSAPRFSEHTKAIASDGAAGWAIADAAAEAISRGENIVSLCLGDTSFDTPDRILKTAIESLQNGRTHYSPVPGTPELRAAIASAQARFDGNDWDAHQATVFSGAQNALFAAVMTVAGAEDEVLYFEPWYATYEATIRAGGARAKPVKTALADETGKLLEQAIAKAISPTTRAILINSPNNPGGYVLTRGDLELVARVAEQHNLWIISDEVYRTAVFDEKYLSITQIEGARERTILVNSLSKSHAMTGWRVGWTLAPIAAAQHLENLAQCMLFGSPTFIQDAAAVALQEAGDAEMEAFSAALRSRRDLMCGRLATISPLSFVRPRGGMFCFVDVSGTGKTGAQFASDLYEAKGLAVVPGVAFGPNMNAYIRISFSASEEVIEEGLERLRAFTETLSGL